jgi:hypothetical protein
MHITVNSRKCDRFSKASADSRQIKIDRWFPGRCKEWKCRVFKILFANEQYCMCK